MAGFLLDTHIWFWAMKGDKHNMAEEFHRNIERWQQEDKAFVSAASVWEIAMMVARERVDLRMSVEHWVDMSTEDGGLIILPLSNRTLIESTRLPGEMHRDPFDRMLVATAREYDLSLVTKDEPLFNYSMGGHVRVRWTENK
jgi:PIN domain nuclease of toxin-antitoxin system